MSAKCEHCSSSQIVDDCGRCGAPVCCQVCCRMAELDTRAEVAGARVKELEEQQRPRTWAEKPKDDAKIVVPYRGVPDRWWPMPVNQKEDS